MIVVGFYYGLWLGVIAGMYCWDHPQLVVAKVISLQHIIHNIIFGPHYS